MCSITFTGTVVTSDQLKANTNKFAGIDGVYKVTIFRQVSGSKEQTYSYLVVDKNNELLKSPLVLVANTNNQVTLKLPSASVIAILWPPIDESRLAKAFLRSIKTGLNMAKKANEVS